MHYMPPPRGELLRLRDVELNYTNAQMGVIFGLASGGQFHKYISDKDRREMGYHVLMHGMLCIALLRGIRIIKIDQLHELARGYGAVIDLDTAGGRRPSQD